MLVANKRYGISGVVPAKNPELAVSTVVSIAPGTTILAGTALGQIPGTGSNVNEVQRITPTGTISGGTFRIGTADGSLTVALAYNATAAQIQAALETILGAGNVACSGGAINSAYVQVTFQGLCGGLKMPLLTITNNLTGISPVLTTTSTTSGKPAGDISTRTTTRIPTEPKFVKPSCNLTLPPTISENHFRPTTRRRGLGL